MQVPLLFYSSVYFITHFGGIIAFEMKYNVYERNKSEGCSSTKFLHVFISVTTDQIKT